MRYKKALVTGGAGFIGSHIVEQLLERGIKTTVIDNFSTGRREYIPKGAKVIEDDILNQRALNRAATGVDIIFHNAAKVSIRHSVGNFADDVKVNVLGTINIIRAVIQNKVKKLIYASSVAVYGEAEFLPITENHPLNPTSPYGISKLASEKYCLLIGKCFNFQTVILRYFNTYGPRQTLTPYVGVITIFINRLLGERPPVIFGDGEQIRDFICVEDVARANILAMEKEVDGMVFNIGTGKGKSINEIANLLIKRINPRLKPKYRPQQPGEANNWISDITQAKKLLGFKPLYQLEEKIAEVIEWNKKLTK